MCVMGQNFASLKTTYKHISYVFIIFLYLACNSGSRIKTFQILRLIEELTTTTMQRSYVAPKGLFGYLALIFLSCLSIFCFGVLILQYPYFLLLLLLIFFDTVLIYITFDTANKNRIDNQMSLCYTLWHGKLESQRRLPSTYRRD